MISNTVTVVGNLVDDPELRFTPSGASVVNFRIASTPRFFDKGAQEWVDGETLFMTVTQWRTEGENVAASLGRGDRVVVVGELKQRNYETKEGDRRSVVEITASEVGASLSFAEVEVKRSRQGRKQDDRRERNQRQDSRPSRKAREGANSRQASRRADRDSDPSRNDDPWASDQGGDEPPF